MRNLKEVENLKEYLVKKMAETELFMEESGYECDQYRSEGRLSAYEELLEELKKSEMN